MTVDASFWTCIGFLVFIILIGKRFVQTTIRVLDARRQRIKYDLDEAARLHYEAEQALAACRHQYELAQIQAQEIIAYAQEEAERLKQQALTDLEEFKRVQQQLLMSQRKRAENQALTTLRDQAVDRAMQKVQDIIGTQLTTAQHNRILEHSLEDIETHLKTKTA